MTPPISAPVYAIMGSLEKNVEEVSNWSRFTRSQFNYEILEGGHFFILKYPGRIADIIRRCYVKSAFDAEGASKKLKFK